MMSRGRGKNEKVEGEEDEVVSTHQYLTSDTNRTVELLHGIAHAHQA